MTKLWNWLATHKAVDLNVLGVIVAIIGYFEANGIFTQYITIEAAILAVCNIIIHAIQGQTITTLKAKLGIK